MILRFSCSQTSVCSSSTTMPTQKYRTLPVRLAAAAQRGLDATKVKEERSELNKATVLATSPRLEGPAKAQQASATGLATNSIFFCFLFCEKSLICLEGKSMTPHRGNTIPFPSSQQLHGLRLVHGTLQDSPLALLTELQRYKDTVRRSQNTVNNN